VVGGVDQTVLELQGLRSKLLEESRIAKAAGNNNRARIHNDLADAVLEDMGAQADNIQGPAGESLRSALDFTREVAQRYKQGSVGKVMGSDRVGGSKVAPELTLDRTIGSGGTKGGVAVSELENAAPTDNLKEGVSQYIMNNFKQKAIKGDKVDLKAAQKFLEDNVDILDKMPDLRSNIEKAASAQVTATTKATKSEGIKKKLFSTQQSQAARFLDSPVGGEINAILKSKNAGGMTAQLRRQVSKDKTGEALKGLKTSALEHLTDKSGLSGKKLTDLMDDKKVSAMLKELFDSKELSRLGQIADELKLLDGTKMVSKRIVDDTPNKILHMIVTTVGARAGAKLGAGTSGASLKTASAGSKLFGDFFKNMTVDKSEALMMKAVMDEDLMKILLMDVEAPLAEKRLGNWLSRNKGFADVLIGGQVGKAAVEVTDEDSE